jgi:hypothetical protein
MNSGELPWNEKEGEGSRNERSCKFSEVHGSSQRGHSTGSLGKLGTGEGPHRKKRRSTRTLPEVQAGPNVLWGGKREGKVRRLLLGPPYAVKVARTVTTGGMEKRAARYRALSPPTDKTILQASDRKKFLINPCDSILSGKMVAYRDLAIVFKKKIVRHNRLKLPELIRSADCSAPEFLPVYWRTGAVRAHPCRSVPHKLGNSVDGSPAG